MGAQHRERGRGGAWQQGGAFKKVYITQGLRFGNSDSGPCAVPYAARRASCVLWSAAAVVWRDPPPLGDAHIPHTTYARRSARNRPVNNNKADGARNSMQKN